MSLSLDDKLLGEKVHYYCSSSEDEREDEEEEDEVPSASSPKAASNVSVHDSASVYSPPARAERNGIVTNTGPKGVIKDWREFKRMETEQREEQEKQKRELGKKLTLTCRSHLNDEQEKEDDAAFFAQLQELDDDFLTEYRLKRLEEMRKALSEIPQFGKVISLTAKNFLEEVDGEKYGVTVIVHIYEQSVAACESMNGCLQCLASEYPTIKFCQLAASDARMSFKFSEKGVPALLIYKNRELLGNFVRLRDELGDDFFANDVESFLQEHGFLPHQESHLAIKDKTTGELRGVLQEDNDSGSDFEVD